ncbi:perlucin-like protein [Mytilus galloprovincialis]|uniref:perlucin-like protein n=1 Tax=Mytilus galloprovincialis TaxID=29158 RepID=UPI003F7C40C4
MFVCALLVIFCCVSVIKSETCYGKDEKSIISDIRLSLKTLEDKLNGKSPRCPAGWKQYKNHCYYFSSDKMSWFEAERKCRNMGAYLVKIADSNENSWIKKTITSKLVKQQYWLGAADHLKEGDWRWMNDLSKVQYSGWHPNEPNNYAGNEDCALISIAHSSLSWNDGTCKSSLGYICENQKGSMCLPCCKV